MVSVYVIIKGTYPDQYEPVAVAGNLSIAKKTALEWVNKFNLENDGFNNELSKDGDNGARISDYEFKKPLTEKGASGDYWDNDMDFVTFKQMEIVTE